MPAERLPGVTPEAAVARHVEWLEHALAAARDEEVRRKGRLDRATDKNRERRAARLAEVTAEVRELSALVVGLKRLTGLATGSTRASTATSAPTKAAPTKAAPTRAAPARRPAPKPRPPGRPPASA